MALQSFRAGIIHLKEIIGYYNRKLLTYRTPTIIHLKEIIGYYNAADNSVCVFLIIHLKEIIGYYNQNYLSYAHSRGA